MSTDWSRYRKCPVCHALIGDPCLSMSGTAQVELELPHSSRELRTVAS